MVIHVNDRQIVGETEDTLFELLQQGEADALITFENSGVNTINYRGQSWNGTTWVDLDVSGTDLYNTLISGQSRMIKLDASTSRVRFLGNASGGSTLVFSVTRLFTRSSGAAIPILAL